MVKCEPPNSRLYHFTGNLEMPGAVGGEKLVVPVPPAAILLRGCSLRNTHKVYGLVLYAGATVGAGNGPVLIAFWLMLCSVEVL